ncbi:hypothetical protein AAG906_011306 [Vitis piasezkii]
MAMAVLSSSLPPLSNPLPPSTSSSNLCCPRIYSSSSSYHLRRRLLRPLIASQLCDPQTFKIDKSSLVVAETVSEDQLWAAACLRIRSFYQFGPSYGIDGFRRVSCINATVPLSQISSFSDDLCAACKFTDNGEDRVVVGTLDLNQCVRLPDEITGMKPQGIGADFLRAYLSNVCVAKELHRNGMGYALVAKSKMVAQEWGITDLYVHFAVDNEPAKQLYMKSGFIYENDEPAWQARFLDRPEGFFYGRSPVNYDV